MTTTTRPPVWCERDLLPALRPSVEARATVLGPATADDRLAGIEDARGAVVGMAPVDAAALDRAPSLVVVARTGIGVDSVDVAEATRRGVAVCNAPDAPTVSTAEHAVALLLAVCKRLDQAQRRTVAGESALYLRHEGIELDGRTLGLVGFGRIARRVATVARGLGMHVVVHDPHLPEPPVDVELADSLDELLASADVVSLHLPLTEDTAGMVGRAQLARMPAGAVLVNTARGGLVDQDALLDALASGHLAGAGLDVTVPEPLPPDHPLLHRDDVVVTPHVATATTACRRRLFRDAFEQVLDVLAGERPPHLVNPAVWPRVAARLAA